MLVFAIISVLSPIVPLAVGLKRRHVLSWEFHALLAYCVFNLLFGIASLYTAWRGVNNHLLTHIFTPFQFTVFILLFSQWHMQRKVQLFLGGLLIAFLIFWLVTTLQFEDVRSFSRVSRPVGATLLVLAATAVLLQLLRVETLSLIRNPVFWVTGGVLLYFAGMSILLTASHSLLRVSAETLRLLWPLQITLHILLNCFFALGFLCIRPK